VAQGAVAPAAPAAGSDLQLNYLIKQQMPLRRAAPCRTLYPDICPPLPHTPINADKSALLFADNP